MRMVEIRFRQTPRKRRHGSRGINFRRDGETRDVSWEDAQHLLKHWPDNFEVVGQARAIPGIAPPPKERSTRPQPREDTPPPSPSSEEYRPPLRTPLTLADITVVVINPYPELFKTHLLPCIPPEVEFIPLENIDNMYWTSGAKALNEGIGAASNEIIMCAHPDLVLGKKWWKNFIYHEARLESWGALGVVGWDLDNMVSWGNDFPSPYKVQCLDENCIIINRKNAIKFDESRFRNWHCYATDYCLQCYDKGLNVYVMPGVADHKGYSFTKVGGFMEERDRTLPILWRKWKRKVSRINMGLKESKFRGRT